MVLLDVRLASDYETARLPGAIVQIQEWIDQALGRSTVPPRRDFRVTRGSHAALMLTNYSQKFIAELGRMMNGADGPHLRHVSTTHSSLRNYPDVAVPALLAVTSAQAGAESSRPTPHSPSCKRG